MRIETLFIIFNVVFFINNLFYLNLVEGVFNVRNNKLRVTLFSLITSLVGSIMLLFFGSMSALGYTIMLVVYVITVMTFYKNQSLMTQMAFVLHFNLHIMVARGIITSILALGLNTTIINLSENPTSFWIVLILTSMLCSVFTIALLLLIPRKYLRVMGQNTQAMGLYTVILSVANIYMIANGNVYIHDIPYDLLPVHQIIASTTWLTASYVGIFLVIGFDILQEKRDNWIYKQSLEHNSIIIAQVNCSKDVFVNIKTRGIDGALDNSCYSEYATEFLKERISEKDYNDVLRYMSIENIIKKYNNGTTELKKEFSAKMSNGEERWLRSVITIRQDKYTGDVFALITVTDDVHEAKVKEIELADTAQRDPLVGAYNKKATQDIIDSLLENEIGGAMLMIDLDNFKAINDNYGHVYGDEVLKEVHKKMQINVRSDDIIGRIGGDEFIVFLKHIDNIKEITKKASIICNSINKVYSKDGLDIEISSSVGIVLAPKHGDNFKELYHNADLAMYARKKASKNGYMLFDENIHLDMI